MSKWPRGAEWRMWDLHVHTPDSLQENYFGSDPWDRYLSELRELPADIRVLGINDYWFLTGYERVRAELDAGNLPNLDEVFPVVEVRCDNFGGVDGKLRRINLHFICDPLLPAAVIQQQLISSLKPKYRLSEDQQLTDWSQVPSRTSFEALGQQIKASVPARRLGDYSSDLIEGFNNICVPFDLAVAAAKENTALSDHVLLATGKTEWEAVKWNDQSIASKKTLINTCELVFTAADTRGAVAAGRAKLQENQVNSKLLDCSDAHTWASSTEKDRLGNVFTWVNADPTFKGLRQAVREYEFRVSFAKRPGLLVRQAQQPDTLMTQVSVRPMPEGSNPAFDFELPLNPGFVAIVGNKGQGKSALVDALALAANSDRHEEFSFLNSRRFLRDGGTAAARYRVGLRWADGQSTPRSLADKHDTKLPSRVDYLPQSLIERVCAADPDSLEKRQFEAEIERVVFRHIDEDERGDATSLRMYLSSKTLDIQTRLDDARADLRVAAERVVALQTRQAELMDVGLEARHLSVSGQIAALDAELARHQAALDLAQAARGEQGAEITADLVAARARQAQLLAQRAAALTAANKQREVVASGTTLATALQETVAQARTQALQLSLLIDADNGNAISVTLEDYVSQPWLVAQREELLRLQSRAGGPGGHTEQLEAVALEIQGLELSLSEQDEGTAAALQALKDAQMRKEHLTGDPADSTSLSGIEAMQDELRATPTNTAEARADLREAFDRIHAEVLLLLAAQDRAYGAAARYVEQTSLLQDVGLDFGVELRVRGFKASWIGKVNRQRLTDFPGVDTPDEVEDVLPALDMTSGPGLYEALAVIEDRLSRVRGVGTGAQRPLTQLMRTNFFAADLLASLYDLSWLQSQYVIRSQGMELRELSPGQRGLVLLMFYLLVDKSARPLLLDQPEENLDNQTVRAYLVPALRQAVQRRQVIAVTHNPNLAVVGDADQLIIASHANGEFSYSTGSLANLAVGLGSIDVLEGTHAAFKNREWKYDQVVGQR